MDEEAVVPEPDITVIGEGPVAGAVVAGIHGDEPSGVKAVERIVEAVESGRLSMKQAVTCIVANPPAVARNTRFIESDLNRSFPGDATGTLEERLAAIVCDEVRDVPTLALHSTRSSTIPFGFAPRDDARVIELAQSMSIPHLVLADGADIGALSACGQVITVEAGEQGSPEAIEMAESLTKEFLIAIGAIDGIQTKSEPAVFELGPEIERPPGDIFEVLVENFTHVSAGEAFATVDGEALVAEEAFYPILLSADGYVDILGFRGTRLADSPANLEIL